MNTPNLTQESQRRKLLPNLMAGLVTGTVVIIVEVSFATLIFSGPLGDYVGRGIGLFLFGVVVIGLVVALTSSFPGTQAGPQDTPAAILALMAAAIAKSMSTTASSDAIFSTVVATIAITSLLTGVFFLALGRFKLGSLVRFVPYPVIGGFLAGTGWLLLLGAMGVMTNASLTLSTLGVLFQTDMFIRWLHGALGAIFLFMVVRRYTHFLIMPAMLVGAVGLFYAALALTNTPLTEASTHGWLLGPFPQGSLWQPITPALLAQTNWSVVLQQMDKIGTILAIAVISLLLNSGGLELAVKQDIDLNHELESAGMGNLLAGLGASPAGYQFLSPTVLSHKMGARGRMASLTAVALGALVLVFGTSLLSIFPRPVLGGLLFFNGLAFLSEWVYDGWFKLPRADYVLVVVILVIVAAVGFLQGVAVGVGIAIALFVINYSRINPVWHTLSGASFHSTVDRPPSQRRMLRDHGEQLWALQLQGYLFFGTAQRLLDQVRGRVLDSQLPGIHFLVLDFARVHGLDSSAVSSFVKMERFAETKNVNLVLAHLSSEIQCQLEQGGVGRGHPSRLRFLPTLDLAVEWCEDQALTAANALRDEPQDDLQAQLKRIFGSQGKLARFMRYLEKVEIDAGEQVVRQGTLADALYFIASGAATANFEAADGRTVRLRTMHCGTIIGDVGLYLGRVRTASVRTTEPSVLYRLSAQAIQRMEERDPEIAATLHEWIARLMAERLAENNNLLASMMD